MSNVNRKNPEKIVEFLHILPFIDYFNKKSLYYLLKLPNKIYLLVNIKQ